MKVNRTLIVCLALVAWALLLRAIFLAQLGQTPFIDELPLIVDAKYYDARAREIAAGQLLPQNPGLLSPFYCYFLGLVYALIGPSIVGAKVVQAIMGAASCVLLYRIARRIFGETTGIVAGLLLASYPPAIYYHGLLLPPTLLVFLHLAVVLLLIGADPIHLRRWVVAGFLIGLAVMTKANAILLLPAVVAVSLLSGRGSDWRRRLVAPALLVVAAGLTLVPITVVNRQLTGAWILVTTTGGSNLLKGNGPTANGTHAFLPIGAQATGVRAHLDGPIDGAEAVRQSRELSRWARRHALQHPLRTLGLAGKKLLLLVNGQELGIRDQLYFARTMVPLLRWPLPGAWLVIPLGLAGICLSWRRWRELALVHAFIATQVVSFMLVFVLARYRLVMIALLMPFAAEVLFQLAQRLERRRWRELAAAVAWFVAAGVLSQIPFREFPADFGFADQHQFVAERHLANGRADDARRALEAALVSSWQDPRTADSKRAEVVRQLQELRQRDEAAGAQSQKE